MVKKIEGNSLAFLPFSATLTPAPSIATLLQNPGFLPIPLRAHSVAAFFDDDHVCRCVNFPVVSTTSVENERAVQFPNLHEPAIYFDSTTLAFGALVPIRLPASYFTHVLRLDGKLMSRYPLAQLGTTCFVSLN